MRTLSSGCLWTATAKATAARPAQTRKTSLHDFFVDTHNGFLRSSRSLTFCGISFSISIVVGSSFGVGFSIISASQCGCVRRVVEDGRHTIICGRQQLGDEVLAPRQFVKQCAGSISRRSLQSRSLDECQVSFRCRRREFCQLCGESKQLLSWHIRFLVTEVKVRNVNSNRFLGGLLTLASSNLFKVHVVYANTAPFSVEVDGISTLTFHTALWGRECGSRGLKLCQSR
mmetsp:Transcript_24534/g.35951  ORF Transcript_24534/g.35951 Transcript_24534/m.35951 type:complete len:229 (-) Transcript_24534:2157-2843(-)